MSMCFGSKYNEVYDEAYDLCPVCREDVDMNGEAIEICLASPELCSECGYAPCDGSC